MKKSSLAIFTVFALIFAVVIPYIALSKEGEESTDGVTVAAADEESRELFQTNCGSCHTLSSAGTDGVVGPNLDELLGLGTPEANSERVKVAVEEGVGGRMPAGILSGEQADEVADYVGKSAGR